jgi:lysine-N-methylase
MVEYILAASISFISKASSVTFMRNATRSLEAQHFGEFRCLAAHCEDTCCDGWAIAVDKPTYDKYRQCTDPGWRTSFDQLITINTADATEHDYARIRLSATTCPFLSEGLCSIQEKFGEGYLPATCTSYPRVCHVVDDVVEKSLDLGCPEAARQVLLDPQCLAYAERPLNSQDFQLRTISTIDSSKALHPEKPYRQFIAVRTFVVWLLQNRAYPLWKRLVILGLFCDKLQEIAAGAGAARIPELIQDYRGAVSLGHFEDLLNQLSAHPAVQLETVVELIIARITSDFTNRRFLACYKEFMDGIPWDPNASMADVCSRYSAVQAQYYAPFMERHGYMLEHYLVNYVYRGLFPFGPQESVSKLHDQRNDRSIRQEFMLMAAYFAVIQMLLGGMAGFHKEAFGSQHVIRVIYTFTRTFEHSQTFPQHVIQALDKNGLSNPRGIAILVKN